MAKNNLYRHELKYELSQSEYLAIRQRLRSVMYPDKHALPSGKYLIRSIYFDNYNDKALLEKLNGVQKREKFRIRFYNDDMSFITVEKKQKINGLCLKLSASITERELSALLQSDYNWMIEHKSPLIQELYCKMKWQQLRPRVLVSYIREPYIYSVGNVRITFDSCIRSSLYNPLPPCSPALDIDTLDRQGQMIMEVKYDAFLPQIISMLLQSGEIHQSAFSKYGICRRFG